MLPESFNWKWGETTPVSVPVREETNITTGDVLFYDDDGFACPASDFQGTREELSNKFIGVAMQDSRPGLKGPIRVATTGTFSFTCCDKPNRLGQYMTVADERGVYRNWQIAKTDNPKEAIGRIEYLEYLPVGKAYIRIHSFLRRNLNEGYA